MPYAVRVAVMLRAMYGFSLTDSFGRTENYWMIAGYRPPMTSG